MRGKLRHRIPGILLVVVLLAMLVIPVIAATLGPTTVGTSTTKWVPGAPYQRQAFYYGGRYWIFYCDGTNEVFRTSLEGTSWTSATTVRTNNAGYHFSVVMDGSSVHYVYSNTMVAGDVYYRMGTLLSSGSITWLAAEQDLNLIDASHICNDPHITVDSNGYPWIGYGNATSGTLLAYGWVAKSSTKDGTWTHETVLFTSPYQFSAAEYDSAAYPGTWASVTALTSGRVYALIQPHMTPGGEVNITGRLFNGATWDAQELVAEPVTTFLSASISTVADSGDNVYLTFADWGGAYPAQTYLVKRTYSTGLWSAPAMAWDGFSQKSLSIDAETETLYLFSDNYSTSDTIGYKTYDGATWSAVTNWIEEANVGGAFTIGGISQQAYNGYFIYVYPQGAGSPYNVRVALLGIEAGGGVEPPAPEEGFEITGANVFSGYLETNDWLFVLKYENILEPYYSNYASQDSFNLQLLDSGTIVAQTPLTAWGYKPGAIYLSATTATSLEWGAAYQLRMTGVVNTTGYNITAADWRGSELLMLDNWCLALADGMESYYNTTFLVPSPSGITEVLNVEGGVIFATGIPYLDIVRPDIFQISTYDPDWEEGDWTHAYPESLPDWEIAVGSTFASVFNDIGTVVSLDGQWVGAILLFIIYFALGIGVLGMGQGLAGLVLATPIIMAGFYFKLIPFAVLGVVIALAALILVRQFFWKST